MIFVGVISEQHIRQQHAEQAIQSRLELAEADTRNRSIPLHVVEMVKEKHDVNFAQITLVTAPLIPASVVTSMLCAATPERPEMPPREPILKPYHVNHMINAPRAIIARAAGRAACKIKTSFSWFPEVIRSVPPAQQCCE